MCVLSCFSCVQLFATLWTVAHQTPLSLGFSRQEYWSGLPCPPPGDIPDQGIKLMSAYISSVGLAFSSPSALPYPRIKPGSHAMQAASLPSKPPGKPTSGKECTCNAGDLGLIPESGISPGGGHGNPLQYSCLENPRD